MRPLARRFRAAVLFANMAALCVAWQDASGPTMTDDAFRPLRPPVLGHVIEWDDVRDLYRLRALGSDDAGEVVATGTLDACQQALVDRLEARHGRGHPNLPFRTPGGMQFWGDVFWYAGWRIQENVYTGHCRLLDRGNVRRAWGSREACRTAFEAIRNYEQLARPPEHLVMLLHGLGRTSDSLARMEYALAEASYGTFPVTYPSTRRSLAEHADQLTALLDRLEGVRQVSFVTHSLGGMVVREALSRDAPWQQRLEVGRLVMLAPPNKGSAMADELADFLPAQIVLGPAARDVVVAEAESIPLPTCPFGIIAAGGPGESGWNPLLTGDDDGVVSVDEARLEGAADFLVVRGLHTFLMNDKTVIEATLRFLETGHFQPVPEGTDEGEGGVDGEGSRVKDRAPRDL